MRCPKPSHGGTATPNTPHPHRGLWWLWGPFAPLPLPFCHLQMMMAELKVPWLLDILPQPSRWDDGCGGAGRECWDYSSSEPKVLCFVTQPRNHLMSLTCAQQPKIQPCCQRKKGMKHLELFGANFRPFAGTGSCFTPSALVLCSEAALQSISGSNSTSCAGSEGKMLGPSALWGLS